MGEKLTFYLREENKLQESQNSMITYVTGPE
jgi:hypothetical protein